MLSWRNWLRGGSILAATGLAVTLLMASVQPSGAGPFQWLTGKNKQQQQPQQQEQPGGGPGLFPFFGGGRGNQG